MMSKDAAGLIDELIIGTTTLLHVVYLPHPFTA